MINYILTEDLSIMNESIPIGYIEVYRAQILQSITEREPRIRNYILGKLNSSPGITEQSG